MIGGEIMHVGCGLGAAWMHCDKSREVEEGTVIICAMKGWKTRFDGVSWFSIYSHIHPMYKVT